MRKIYYRIYQGAYKLASDILKWPKPIVYKGEGQINSIKEIIEKEKINKLLIVTDKGLIKIGIVSKLEEILKNNNIDYEIFSDVKPNPTLQNVEDGYNIYKNKNCQGIIAIGGGSPIDCAKAIGIRVVRPNTPLKYMRGQLKVLKKLPVLIAVPTTSGTGSEATLAAVITDEKGKDKYAINDLVLIPKYAILDPVLTVNLPNQLTATTGIDALTHAIEAYIGNSNTAETKENAKKAVKLIMKNLKDAYNNGNNIIAREKMQEASYLAGCAFTKAYVGYVHAIAHALGGQYGIAHGLANSIILTKVLRYYGESVHYKLAELYNLLYENKSNLTEKEKSEKFITDIEQLIKSMNIPDKFDNIKSDDIDNLIRHVLREANPLYPVPKILFYNDFLEIFDMITEGGVYETSISLRKSEEMV